MIEHETFESRFVLCALYVNKISAFVYRACVFSMIHGKIQTVNVYYVIGTELYIYIYML